MEQIHDFFIQNFPILFLMCAFCAMVHGRRRTKVGYEAFIWLGLLVTFILSILSTLEIYTADSTELNTSMLRYGLSYACYVLRPIVIILSINALSTKVKKKFWFYLPQLINMVIMIPCFFTKWVFYYDETGEFFRGPLGYFVFITGIFYYVMFIIVVVDKIKFNFKKNGPLLIVISLFNLIALYLDTFYHGSNVQAALTISIVFFFLLLNYQYSGVDSLTNLYNRDAFNFDKEWDTDTISAIASIDLNGLKRINDEFGHSEGDIALKVIGSILNSYNTRKVRFYRIGGDEFIIIFRSTDELTVKATLAKIKIDAEAHSYSLSSGYAYKHGDESILELWRASDYAMYDDKAFYYAKNGIERR